MVLVLVSDDIYIWKRFICLCL